MKTNTSGRSKIGRDASNGDRAPSAGAPTRSSASIIFAFFFLYFITGLTFVDKLSVWVLAAYLLASIAAFITYALDKSAAKNNQWRTQEATLHLFALAGGWPGALIAQRLLRHKTKKQSFQVVFWATVALNCGILGWLFSSSGADALRAFLWTP